MFFRSFSSTLCAIAFLALAQLVAAHSTHHHDKRSHDSTPVTKRDHFAIAPKRQQVEVDLMRAQRYLGEARTAANEHLLERVADIVGPLANLPRPPLTALILRASLRQRQHEFDAALEDVQAVLERQPQNASALLLKATILTVKGQYSAAARTCARLTAHTPLLVRTTCIARLASLTGDTEKSYAALQRVISTHPYAPAAYRHWAHVVQAETANRLGHTDAAFRHFERALELEARDSYALAAYADFLLDNGEYTEVVSLLQEFNTHEGLLLRRAIALQRLGQKQAAARVAHEFESLVSDDGRGEMHHLREWARFELDVRGQPKSALEFALMNWREQREPWDARLVLEAALAARAPSRALEVITWIRRVGLSDVRLNRIIGKLSTTISPTHT